MIWLYLALAFGIGVIVGINLHLVADEKRAWDGILRGKDAKRFSEKMKWNEAHAAPKEEYDRVMATYRKLKPKEA